MPFFSQSSSVEQVIEQATDGKKTSENWAEILEVVDVIGAHPSGAKDAVRALMKRVKNRDPHVGLQALTVLDACVINSSQKFHLEVASRFFDEEVRGILQNSQNYSRLVVEKLCGMIKKWSENEFKSNSALSIIPSLYGHIRNTNPGFIPETAPGKAATQTTPRTTDPAAAAKKEEDDFAKAIALSLEEDQKKKRASSASAVFAPAASSSLYPSMNDSNQANNAIYATVNKPKEPRKVRAMYDFEAAEDNELTFKAGEIIHVLDDSDANWWKGANHRGEGLFPTNFVTSDLNYEPENEFASSSKKLEKDDTISLASETVEQKPVKIDEGLIDQTLNLIHDADPTGERPDPADLLSLEDQCSRMWPLIDDELQKADRLQTSLDELSNQVSDALAMYDNVMKEQVAQLASGMHSNQAVSAEHGYYGQQNPMVPPGSSGYQSAPPNTFYQGQPGSYQDPGALQNFPNAMMQQLPYANPAQQPNQPGYQQFLPNAAKLAAAAGGTPLPQDPSYNQPQPTHANMGGGYAPASQGYINYSSPSQ